MRGDVGVNTNEERVVVIIIVVVVGGTSRSSHCKGSSDFITVCGDVRVVLNGELSENREVGVVSSGNGGGIGRS